MYLFRQLRRNRLFSAVVILMLALGIGADTLVFSLVNELILKPLPVRNPGNLFLAETLSEHQVRPDTNFSYPVFEGLFSKTPLVSAAVAEQEWSEDELMPLTSGGSVRLAIVQMVSPNYFTELGIRPVVGSLPQRADAAVLSFQFWQSEFAGSRDVIGRTIRLKGAPFTVAGILPREFHSSDLDRAPDVRVPVAASVSLNGFDIHDPRNRRHGGFRILLRLAAGVTPGHLASALLPPLLSARARETREENQYSTNPVPAAQLEKEIQSDDARLRFEFAGRGVSQLRDQFSRALWLLLGGVALLLLVVCANVAGLLLARSAGRRRELAIRSALGAGRWRLVRQLLSENLLLAVPGAALGAALAWIGAPQLIRLLPPPRDYGQFGSPQILTIEPDARVLLFLAAATGFCVLAFGLVPAWRVSLSSEWRAGRGYSRATAGLIPVALQAAFSVVLLAGAALMLRTFHNLNRIDPGFDREHVVSFTFDPADVGYTPARAGAFYVALRDRAAALPGVRSAAYASRGLMRAVGVKTTLAPQGVTLPEKTFLNTSLNEVDPRYFETMGIPLLAGRNLTRDDVRRPVPIVVNRAFADFFFRGENPVGRMMVQGRNGTLPPTHVIVGLVGTAKYRSMREPDPPTFYTALDLFQGGGFLPLLNVRTWGPPETIVSAVRKTAQELAPAVPLLEALTLEQEVQTSLWQERLLALLSGFFGIASVLLAAIGLYGSLAHSVAQRTRELGIRVAVGARFRHIVQTICGQLAAALACGLAAGLIGAWFLLRATTHLLFGVQARDPLSVAAAIGVILLCALLGAAPPARRAARIDPASALREE